MSWDSFYSSFKRAVGTAADKINQTTDIATLQVKLGVAEHKLEAAYAQLGRDAYRQFTTDEDVVDAVEKSMALVESAQRVVDDLTARIDACKSRASSTDGKKDDGKKEDGNHSADSANSAENPFDSAKSGTSKE